MDGLFMDKNSEIGDMLDRVSKMYPEIRERESIHYINRFTPVFERLFSDENLCNKPPEKPNADLNLIYFALPIANPDFEVEELKDIYYRAKVKNGILQLGALKIGFDSVSRIIKLGYTTPGILNYDTSIGATVNGLDQVFEFCRDKDYLIAEPEQVS